MSRRALVLVATVPALPIAIATLIAIARGWTPLFDQAIIATNALDSLTVDLRLVGVYSDASLKDAPPVYGTGPLFLWLIAPAARFTDGWGLPLTIGVVNAASAAGAVILAKRVGGWILCVATALAIAVMLGSLPAGAVYDPLNPSCALLPFTCLLFIAWAVGCGAFRLLPVLVLAGSFVLQAHFSLGLAVIGCVGVALIGLGTLAALGDFSRGTAARRSAARWALGAAIVGVLCWAPAVVDEVLHTPGNLTRLKDTALSSETTLGWEAGWNTWVRAVGIRPWWLRDTDAEGRLTELLHDPGARAEATAVLALVALAVALGLGLYRRRANLAVPAGIALTLFLAIVISTAQTPARLTFAFEKATRWTLPAGMFVWLILLYMLVAAARKRQWPLFVAAAARIPRTLVVGAAVVILSVAVVVSTRDTSRQTRQLRHADAARTMVKQVVDNVDSGAQVLVELDARSALGETFQLQTAIVYGLRKQAHGVLVRQGTFALADKLGDDYRLSGRHPDTVVTVTDGTPAIGTGRVVSRVRLPLDPGASTPITLTATVKRL